MGNDDKSIATTTSFMTGCKLCDNKSSALATSQVKKTSEIFYGSNAGTSKSTERKIGTEAVWRDEVMAHIVGENKALGKGGKARCVISF